MESLLRKVGLEPVGELGEGDESVIYALDEQRVARVHRDGTSEATVTGRRELLEELGAKRDLVSFDFPEVQDILEDDGRFVSIESRLHGEPMHSVLGGEVTDRKKLLRSYFNTAKEIGLLTPERPWYGDLLRDDFIHSHSFLEYAIARGHDNLFLADEDFRSVNAVNLADELIESQKSLVHMDFFPGNVLVEDEEVTAVLDFSVVSILGDRRLDLVSAAVYLDEPITPTATDEDRSFALTWLEANELHRLYDPVKRWLAAFWCCTEDVRLHNWCRSVLLQPPDSQ
jgi:hypothetical protein